MSGYTWLKFIAGIPIVAVLGAVAHEFVSPMLDIAGGQSTTDASAKGLMWFNAAWDWMPLMVLLLLVMMLIVGVVVRRQSVGGIP